jgi:cytochrome c oxidase subunit 3
MEVAEKVKHLHSDGHFVTPEDEYSSTKLGMWLFLATELLLFGGLFTAYAIYRAKYGEMFFESHKELNVQLGAINTLILIFSSFTVAVGVTAIQRGNRKLLSLMLAITIICGLLFGVNKYFEYSAKFHHGIFPSTNIYFGLYFMMTGLHMLHVLVGVAILFILLILNLRGRFSKDNYTGIEVGALYWHLVDLIWIYLFPLLYLVA